MMVVSQIFTENIQNHIESLCIHNYNMFKLQNRITKVVLFKIFHYFSTHS